MSLEQRLSYILCQQLQVNEEDLAEISLDGVSVDSLEMLELIVTIEEEFDIDIDEKKFAGLVGFQQICDYIAELIKDE